MEVEQLAPKATPARSTRLMSPFAPFVVLIAIAALVDLAILLSPAEDVYGPGPAYAGGLGEELDRGNIAYELQHGPLLEVLDYQWATFFGGSLVMGAAAVPFFVLLGPSLLALKLTPVVFHLCTLSLVILVLNRFVSRRAAWFGGSLMALCPPGYALMTTICFGTHVEQNLFAMGYLYLCLEVLVNRRRNPLLWLGWGCLAGLGIYFNYTFGVVLVVCWLFTLIAARRHEVGSATCFASYLAGFLVGLAPWWLYNRRFDFVGVRIYDASMSSNFSGWGSPAQVLDNLGYVVFAGLPDSSFFRTAWFGVEWSQVYFFSLFILVAVAAWVHRDALLPSPGSDATPVRAAGVTVRILLAYVAIYLLTLSSSSFVEAVRQPPFAKVTAYRYLMPVYPFLFMLAGVALASLDGRSANWRSACVAIVGLLCATSVVHTLRGCDPTRFGILLHTPGYSIGRLGEWFVRRYPGDVQRLQLVVDGAALKRSAQYREELYGSMGSLLDRFLQPPGPRLEYDRGHLGDYARAREFLREHVPPEYRDFFSR